MGSGKVVVEGGDQCSLHVVHTHVVFKSEVHACATTWSIERMKSTCLSLNEHSPHSWWRPLHRLNRLHHTDPIKFALETRGVDCKGHIKKVELCLIKVDVALYVTAFERMFLLMLVAMVVESERLRVSYLFSIPNRLVFICWSYPP